MKAKTVSVSVTKVTASTEVITGNTSHITISVDDKNVRIEVPAEVKAYFMDQFSRPNPTALQRRKHATVMSLMCAAYLQGKKDGTA